MLDPAFFHTGSQDGVALVVAGGELDMSTAPQLEQALAAAVESGGGPVLLDLCEVSFFDSSGLRAALVAHRRLAESGRTLAIACEPGKQVERVFEVTGVDSVLDLHPSREAALDALG